MREKRHVYQIFLVSKFGVTKSVFIKARDRNQAEKRALRRNPGCKIDHSPQY